MTVLRFVLLLTVLVVATSISAEAGTRCFPVNPMVQRCTSEVDFTRFSSSYATQKMSQWCWAAAVSMLFDYYGHPLAQEKIVMAQYGRITNLPAGNGFTLASQLNRKWVDDNGEDFSASLTAAFDPAANIYAMNNFWIINELDAERPFIVGTQGHAVVATSITYDRSPQGLMVIGVGVFDPWPGRGARSLSQNEMTPSPNGLSFAASAYVKSL
jgi:papain like cysteine protease AvrRpt2